MWVIIRHPYFKFDVCRPSSSADWFSVGVLSSLVTLVFDLYLLTMNLVRNISSGTDNLSANFGVSATIHCRIMGKHASDWWHDVITLTFDLWCTCQWSRSSYSIPIPSLKFVGHPFWKYDAFSVSALIVLVTLTFDLLASKWGHGSPVSWVSFLLIFSFLHPSILGTVQTKKRTDRRWSSVLNAPPYKGGSVMKAGAGVGNVQMGM